MYFRKIFSAALAAVMLAGVLASCAGGQTPGETEQTAEETFRDVEIVIGENGRSNYTVIIPEKGGFGESSAGSKFYMSIGPTAFQGFKYSDDWMKPGTEEDPDACEIVIGATNRSVSSELAAKLKAPKDYIIAVRGNRIAVCSASSYGIQKAMEDLTARTKNENGRLTITVPEYLCVVYDYPAKNMKIGGRPLSDYVIVVPVRNEQYNSIIEKINGWAMEYAGFELPSALGTDAQSDCEILIGNTGREASNTYYLGAGVLGKKEYAVSLSGTKMVAAYPSYASSAVNALMNRLQTNSDITDFSDRKEDDAYSMFRYDNYAAGRLPDDFLDSLSPGVLGEVSCFMYYEDTMKKARARGEKWVYSNDKKYGLQGKFDNMVRGQYHAANCGSQQGWMIIDLGILPSGHMYGNIKESIYGLNTMGPIVQCVGVFTHWRGQYTFDQLFRKGHVKPGDIFYCTNHTFVYLGLDKFFATGHDSIWHTDPDAYTEDARKAVFDEWIVDRATCHDSSYKINYTLRFKDEFVPHFYRNAEGRLAVNPMWSAETSIEYKEGVSPTEVTTYEGVF